MEFVPRSHTIDVVRHRSINNDPRVHGLELHPDEFHHVKNVAVCPLPPGGATFHGGYMFHHTGPNRSDVPRRAIILGISKPGVPRKPERRFPWLEEKKTARTVRAEKAKLAAVKPPFVE